MQLSDKYLPCPTCKVLCQVLTIRPRPRKINQPTLSHISLKICHLSSIKRRGNYENHNYDFLGFSGGTEIKEREFPFAKKK